MVGCICSFQNYKISAKGDRKIEYSFARVEMHILSLYGKEPWSAGPCDLLKEGLDEDLVGVSHIHKDLYIGPRTIPWRAWREQSQTSATNMQ
jgi:hypothetical protein